jgi:serine/threonine protein kinase
MAGGSAQPGTPAYQAPEMLLFQRSANAKTDVWALCCTVVEVLCESPIWDFPLHLEEDPVTYITEQMRKKVVPDGVKVLKSQVCSTIYAVLCYGLSYRPEERPEALQIVKALQQMQSI